jgi:hypothetical protein
VGCVLYSLEFRNFAFFCSTSLRTSRLDSFNIVDKNQEPLTAKNAKDLRKVHGQKPAPLVNSGRPVTMRLSPFWAVNRFRTLALQIGFGSSS